MHLIFDASHRINVRMSLKISFFHFHAGNDTEVILERVDALNQMNMESAFIK